MDTLDSPNFPVSSSPTLESTPTGFKPIKSPSLRHLKNTPITETGSCISSPTLSDSNASVDFSAYMAMPVQDIGGQPFGDDSSDHTPLKLRSIDKSKVDRSKVEANNGTDRKSSGPSDPSEDKQGEQGDPWEGSHSESAGSRPPDEPKKIEIPDCEVRTYILELGKSLGKSEEDLHPVLQRLICENWLESISHLLSLADADWNQLGLPKQLQRLMKSNLTNARAIIHGSKALVSPTHSNRVEKHPSIVEDIVAQMATTMTPRATPGIPQADVHGNFMRPVHAGGPATHASIQGPSQGNQSGQYLAPSSSNFGQFGKQTDSVPHPPSGYQTGYNAGPSPTHPHSFHQAPAGNFGRNASSSQSGASPSEFNFAARDEGNEVERFVKRVCERHGRTLGECTAAVQCLVHDNWFDSLVQLRALTPSQWEVLEIPLGLMSILPNAVADELASADDSLERVIVKAGSSTGRTAPQLQTAIQRLRDSGYRTADSLKGMPAEAWSVLRLPLRLLEEVQSILNEGLSPSTFETQTSFLMQGDSRGFGDSFGQVDRSMSYAPDMRIVSNKEEREARVLSVDRFLKHVGQSVGKSEDEMAPIIHRIVKENWFDTIPALWLLKPEEWQEFGLPKRLVEAIKQGLDDPFVLQFNTVQFTVPESEIFACDVIAAIWKLEAEVPPNELPDVLRSMLKLMETILCNPFEESKRVIRKSNANFQKRAGQFKSGILVLESIGYIDAGSNFFLPVAYISRITEAHAALAQLAQLHRDRLKKSTKTTKLFSSIR